MKIIVFAPYYPPHLGGLENYIDQLNQRLSEKGAKITVFTPDIPKAAPREQKGAITVVRFPAFELIPNYPWPKFWRPGFLKKYFALHKKKYDLVMSHTRFFSTSLLALKFSKSKKIKWIHVEHGSDYSKLDTFWLDALAQIYDHTLGWLVLKAADKIVVVSDSACRFVKKISKRKSKVIYPGFDPTFIGSIKPAAFLPAPGKSKNNIARLNLIFIGRLIHGKGTADLIKAIDILRNQNIICRIIGEGPQKRQLKKLIAQKKLNKIIKLTGAKNHRQTIAFL
ncbi:glycosyltransferase family 4 protein, partial [Patescibacteria group bacterium]|nr:glycosyltransferase family 4 protein [Patescibacteria group bacterium]